MTEEEFQLRPTAESHLWKLVELSEDEGEEEKDVRAYLGVYVDDLVVAAKDDILVELHGAAQAGVL